MKRRSIAVPRGAALAALLVLLVAVPVAADVGVQNFMRAEVTSAEPCFVTTAGPDALAGNGFLTFDSTPTVDENGVDLVQELLQLTAFAGDRLFYTEALIITNTCGTDLSVQFLNADDPAGNPALEPATGAPWDGIHMRFYLEDPAGVGVTGLTGTYATMLEALAGTVTTTGSVVIPAGQSRNLAVTIDTDGAMAPALTGVLRWVAVADHA